MQVTRRQMLAAALIGGGALSLPAAARAALPRDPAAQRLAAARAALERHGAAIPFRDRVGIADFGLHSRLPRFFLIDLESGTTSAHLVAHGRGSDPDHCGRLERFSNRPGSAATSDGAYLTAQPYVGQHGASRRLKGLDPSNDQAEPRAIVIHAAWYVAPTMVAEHGKLGRSEGCFAFTGADLPAILDRLGPGRLLLAGRFHSA